MAKQRQERVREIMKDLKKEFKQDEIEADYTQIRTASRQKVRKEDFDELYREKLTTRILIHKKLSLDDPKFKAQIKMACSEDFEFFCDNFLFTYNPRAEVKKLPFILYPKQRDLINWVQQIMKDKHNGFIDKPRDVGATVTIMAFVFWMWLFDKEFSCRVGSRKQHYVDKTGDKDTLFAKLDYMLDGLPDFLRPVGFVARKHRTKLGLVNPEMNSVIQGESSNQFFSRGGRQTIVVFDELAFWDYARSAWESAGDVTDTRLAMTTPPSSGKSSFVYKLKEGENGHVEVFDFVYSDVPHKTQEWYLKQKDSRSEEELNREVLKSYSGGSEGKVYLKEWEVSVKSDPSLAYRPSLPLYVSWDIGLDATSLIWWQKDKETGQVYMIDCYENYEKSYDFFYPFVGKPIVSGVGGFKYSPTDLRKIGEHSAWGEEAIHYGDPSITHRSMGTKGKGGKPASIQKLLQDDGIYVQSKANPGHLVLKEKAKKLFRRLIVNPRTCSPAIEAITSAAYPKRQGNSQSTEGVKKPIHDWTSHFRTSMEYFADNEETQKRTTYNGTLRKVVGSFVKEKEVKLGRGGTGRPF